MVLASVRGAGGGGERMAKAAVWATIVAMGYAQGDGTGQAQGLFPYTAHDLAVATSDGLQLGGTLLIPTPRAGGGQQRFPAAVMVHGSGPNDRDEALQLPGGSFAPFQQIAETLAGAGWVVYRYDKRTCHPDGTAGHDHCTNNIASLNVPAMRIEDFVSDAVAALELVAGRREVSITDGLAVIGHSQGAFPVGPLAAAAYPAVNKLAMLMGPSLPIDQIYLDQISRFQSPAAADVMRPAFDALNAAIANGDDPAAIDTSSLGAGANTGAFWASWMRATAPTQVSTVLSSLVARGVKLLALNSPDDVQVYPAAYEDMQTQIGRLRQRGILVRALSHDLVGSPPKESRTTAVCSTVLVGLRDFIAGTGAWGRSGGGRLTQRCEDAAQPCGDAVLRGLSDSDPELAADLQSGSTLTCGQLSDRLLEAALDPEQTDPGAIDCVAAGDLDNSQSFLVLAESCAAARAAARAADASGSNCRPIAVALDFIAAINHQRDATMPPITSALAGALTPTQLDGLASQLPCSSPTGARAQPASDDHYWTVLISCGGALDSAGVMLSVALENDSLQVAGLHTVPLEHLDRPPAERNCAASSGPQVPAPGPPPRLPASSPVPPSGCPVVVDVRSVRAASCISQPLPRRLSEQV